MSSLAKGDHNHRQRIGANARLLHCYCHGKSAAYVVRLTVTDDLDGVAEAVFEVNVRDDAGVAFTVSYVPDGTYGEELRPCAYPGSSPSSACTLDRLPFIGMEHSTPTIDDVMARVLVSHRRMGDNFREILEQRRRRAVVLLGQPSEGRQGGLGGAAMSFPLAVTCRPDALSSAQTAWSRHDDLPTS